jgi:hypothetical protein
MCWGHQENVQDILSRSNSQCASSNQQAVVKQKRRQIKSYQYNIEWGCCWRQKESKCEIERWYLDREFELLIEFRDELWMSECFSCLHDPHNCGIDLILTILKHSFLCLRLLFFLNTTNLSMTHFVLKICITIWYLNAFDERMYGFFKLNGIDFDSVEFCSEVFVVSKYVGERYLFRVFGIFR